MAVVSDPRYQALASQLAGLIGGGTSSARALLALMACEKGGEWPPQDNNPLNFHVGTAADAGVRGLHGGIGDNGAVASMPTPTDAIVVTAQILQRLGRYRGVLAAAATDDGAGLLTAWGSSGWGTSAGCARTYYGATPATPARPIPIGSNTRGTAGVPAGGTPSGNEVATILGKRTTDLLTAADIDKVADHFSGMTFDPLGTNRLVTRGVVHGELDPFIGQPIGNIRPDALAGVIGGIGTIPQVPAQVAEGAATAAAGVALQVIGAIVPILVNGAILLLALVLAYKGLRDLVVPE